MENEDRVYIEEDPSKFSAVEQRKKMGFDAAIQEEKKPNNIIDLDSYRNRGSISNALDSKDSERDNLVRFPWNGRVIQIVGDEKKNEELEKSLGRLSYEGREWTEYGLEEGLMNESTVIADPAKVDRMIEDRETALHEGSHLTALKIFGSFSSATVKRDGPVRGLTSGHAKDNTGMMVALAISLHGERAFGIQDNSGCGSDRFRLKMLSSITSIETYGNTHGALGIENHADSIAATIAYGSKSIIKRRGFILARDQTITSVA